jgi:hypothetical protein
MNETLLRFGQGVIKVLVSLCVGVGIGLVTFGDAMRGIDNIWNTPGPPAELFLAIGAALLATGIMMALLFFVPRLWSAPKRLVSKPPVYDEALP